MISSINTKGSESKDEVYNINKIDQFIENFNSLKKDRVRIIKYVKQENKVWINKLNEIEYDGQRLTYISYDTYANGDNSTKEKPTQSSFAKIVKTHSSDGIRYALLENKDTPDNAELTIISFLSNSIRN